MAEPPGFCYILHETDSSPFCIEQCSSNILPCKSPVYIQLSEVWKSEAMRRTSCLVKVFYIHMKESTNMLYVTDYSLKTLQSYSIIQVSNACDFPAKLSSLTERAILILRDVFLSQGELHADEYTSISLPGDMLQIDSSMNREISRLQQVAIDVTDIHKGVTENDLCIIKGHISEVDEDSAYSWEACVHCGSDQLQGDSSQGITKCLTCKKTMEEPSTKMKMEVIVTCEKSDIQAKVDLLQMTIENLLPADEMDEEGYELSSVLSKKIGPLKCVVLSSNSDTFILKEIDLLK
ncbi:DNA repair-scaffolding protein-like [Mercenaria mercenaria]|uniref:DNA repair-scaffolding protein-like n=1 Tax=Mercenaria mercenaria TaxID=6596 RepID=UPI00234FAE98|nr:DNA repair-scaffolding protein-like [Mercenaria mercenaria]